MKEFYVHTSIHLAQSPKRRGEPCGDVFGTYRDESSTTLVLCDGIGSGLKANIYANMCCSRIINLIKEGASVQDAFEIVGKTMNDAWGTDQPFSVFTILQISSSGNAILLSYDMPAPVFISEGFAYQLETKVSSWKKAMIQKASFRVNKNEGILLLSDGITQAGLGQGLVHGWETKGVVNFLNQWIKEPKPDADLLTEAVHQQARKFWGIAKGDDCSVALAFNRKGITVNILTGPPSNIEDDENIIQSFLKSEGIKVVSGGSTAKMLSRVAKRSIEISESGSSITPPTYKIKGITLATEGIVTLNQVYNILFEKLEEETDGSSVFELADYLQVADKIIFWLGNAPKKGAGMNELKQLGIRDRSVIVDLIADKLRKENKLVIIKQY